MAHEDASKAGADDLIPLVGSHWLIVSWIEACPANINILGTRAKSGRVGATHQSQNIFPQ